MQEVQKGVSAAFDKPLASDSSQQGEPQASLAAPRPDANQASEGAGQAVAGTRVDAEQPSGGAGQAAAGPRTLWSEAAELAEARERSQWHELMSRRNMEPSEKLQVRLLVTLVCLPVMLSEHLCKDVFVYNP